MVAMKNKNKRFWRKKLLNSLMAVEIKRVKSAKVQGHEVLAMKIV